MGEVLPLAGSREKHMPMGAEAQAGLAYDERTLLREGKVGPVVIMEGK